MKLGDSLGRSRRRRKRRGGAPDEDSAGTEDSMTGEAAGEQGGGGAGADGSEGGRDDGTATEARSDERGASQTGRGPTSAGAGRRATHPLLRGRSFLIGIGVLLLAGWVFGYTIATRVVFPAPPPPGDLFEVPDLRGLGLASAKERLAGAGLELGAVDSLQHPSVAAGLVLGQSPLPGQVSRPDQPVRVTVSSGPQTRSIPDVRRLDEDRARVVLETSGFVVSVDVAESEEPRGVVIDVSPPPDSVVALPAQVRLTVSAGPPVVPMPLVLGMAQADAQALLDSLGLVVEDVEEVFRFGRDQGIVVEQEPAADTELQRGSTVHLKVGRRGRQNWEQ